MIARTIIQRDREIGRELHEAVILGHGGQGSSYQNSEVAPRQFFSINHHSV
jgi:hypothetical protein